jgi:hypothetical protein
MMAIHGASSGQINRTAARCCVREEVYSRSGARGGPVWLVGTLTGAGGGATATLLGAGTTKPTAARAAARAIAGALRGACLTLPCFDPAGVGADACRNAGMATSSRRSAHATMQEARIDAQYSNKTCFSRSTS